MSAALPIMPEHLIGDLYERIVHQLSAALLRPVPATISLLRK
jgi:hypothetical protein